MLRLTGRLGGRVTAARPPLGSTNLVVKVYWTLKNARINSLDATWNTFNPLANSEAKQESRQEGRARLEVCHKEVKEPVEDLLNSWGLGFSSRSGRFLIESLLKMRAEEAPVDSDDLDGRKILEQDKDAAEEEGYRLSSFLNENSCAETTN